MYIDRTISQQIFERLVEEPRKIIILYGQRQVGKTTLAQHVLKQLTGKNILQVNADFDTHLHVFSSRDISKLRLFVAGIDYLLIDEAQRIPDIGINLKILHDNFPDLRILVTGSSSLDLANRISEPLTGRTWTFYLHPFSAEELTHHLTVLEYHSQLEEWMIYGSYPGVYELANSQHKASFLVELTRSYLYKDILEITGIRFSNKLRDILRLLAFQIGSEVSFNELGRTLGLDTLTIQRYIDLLEKSFVVKIVGGFSQNLRKEISKKQKIYFLDLGVRNAIIENFADLSMRNDKGAIWENYLYIERTKHLNNHAVRANQYFWRLHTGTEIDYVEEKDGTLSAYEFKSGTKKIRVPKAWHETYPDATFQIIDRDNYLSFIM